MRTIEKSVIGVVDHDLESSGVTSTQCSISAPVNTDLKRGIFVRIGDGPSYYVAQVIGGPYYTGTKGESSKARYIAEISSYIEDGIERPLSVALHRERLSGLLKTLRFNDC